MWVIVKGGLLLLGVVVGMVRVLSASDTVRVMLRHVLRVGCGVVGAVFQQVEIHSRDELNLLTRFTDLHRLLQVLIVLPLRLLLPINTVQFLIKRKDLTLYVFWHHQHLTFLQLFLYLLPDQLHIDKRFLLGGLL